jgi:hypothetical protein
MWPSQVWRRIATKRAFTVLAAARTLRQPACLVEIGRGVATAGDHVADDRRAIRSIGILGWFTIALPAAFYLFVLVAGPMFLVRTRDEEVGPQLRSRALLAAVGVAVFVTMAVALYAFLSPIGSGHLSVQGRYLAPVWLLLLSVYGIAFARNTWGNSSWSAYCW